MKLFAKICKEVAKVTEHIAGIEFHFVCVTKRTDALLTKDRRRLQSKKMSCVEQNTAQRANAPFRANFALSRKRRQIERRTPPLCSPQCPFRAQLRRTDSSRATHHRTPTSAVATNNDTTKLLKHTNKNNTIAAAPLCQRQLRLQETLQRGRVR